MAQDQDAVKDSSIFSFKTIPVSEGEMLLDSEDFLKLPVKQILQSGPHFAKVVVL